MLVVVEAEPNKDLIIPLIQMLIVVQEELVVEVMVV
jgi:hypothetical protein